MSSMEWPSRCSRRAWARCDGRRNRDAEGRTIIFTEKLYAKVHKRGWMGPGPSIT